jgi:hypothetical protein
MRKTNKIQLPSGISIELPAARRYPLMTAEAISLTLLGRMIADPASTISGGRNLELLTTHALIASGIDLSKIPFGDFGTLKQYFFETAAAMDMILPMNN